MNRLQAKEKPSVNEALLRQTLPDEKHFDTLISEPCLIVDEAGVPLIAYQHIDDTIAIDQLVSDVRSIKYTYADRSSGMMSQSRVFGFQPRIAMRRDYCNAASMTREHPQQHATLLWWASYVSGCYAVTNQDRYAKQMAQLEKVRPEWRLPNSAFTSGIVNKDNNLLYHHDAGNFPGVWSCMIVLQQDMRGGHLVVPRYGLAFSFPRASLFMFDGQSLLHGVLPMQKRSSLGYRYSIVYYALKQMCNCLSPQEEIERIRVLKTTRELKRAKR